jgi:hypothetical protein
VFSLAVRFLRRDDAGLAGAWWRAVAEYPPLVVEDPDA